METRKKIYSRRVSHNMSKSSKFFLTVYKLRDQKRISLSHARASTKRVSRNKNTGSLEVEFANVDVADYKWTLNNGECNYGSIREKEKISGQSGGEGRYMKSVPKMCTCCACWCRFRGFSKNMDQGPGSTMVGDASNEGQNRENPVMTLKRHNTTK